MMNSMQLSIRQLTQPANPLFWPHTTRRLLWGGWGDNNPVAPDRLAAAGVFFPDRMKVEKTDLSSEGSLVCIVCGNIMSSGRKSALLQHNERTVKVCCGLCVKVFKRNPEPFVELLQKVERVRRWSAMEGAHDLDQRRRGGMHRCE